MNKELTIPEKKKIAEEYIDYLYEKSFVFDKDYLSGFILKIIKKYYCENPLHSFFGIYRLFIEVKKLYDKKDKDWRGVK